MKAALLDGDTINYDLDRGFTRHLIDDNNGQGIVIKLAQPYIINTIRMLLWDRDQRYTVKLGSLEAVGTIYASQNRLKFKLHSHRG